MCLALSFLSSSFGTHARSTGGCRAWSVDWEDLDHTCRLWADEPRDLVRTQKGHSVAGVLPHEQYYHRESAVNRSRMFVRSEIS